MILDARRAYRGAFLIYALLVPIGTVSFGRAIFDLSLANLSLLAILPLFTVAAVVHQRPVIDRFGFILLLILIGMPALRYLISYDPLYVTTFTGYILVYSFAFFYVESARDLLRLLQVIIVGIAVLNVLALLDGFRIVDIVESHRVSPVGSWHPKVERTTGVPGLDFGIFGLYNLISFAVLLYVSLARRNILFDRRIALGLLGLNLMAAFLSQSRSTWFLHFPVAVLVLATVYYAFPRRRLLVAWIASVGLMAVGALLIRYYDEVTLALDAVLHMRDYSKRFRNFASAADYVQSDWRVPLVGGGAFGFLQFSGSEHIDNQFVNIFVRGGVIVWAAFAAFWLRAYGTAVRGIAGKREARSFASEIMMLLLLLLVTATAIVNFWARVSNQKILWLIFGALAAWEMSRRRAKGGDAPTPSGAVADGRGPR